MLTYDAVFSSPIGKIGIVITQNNLTRLDIVSPDMPEKIINTPQSKKIIAELKAYFKNPGHHFNVDIFYQGTPFQQKVWNALKAIPSGKTLTYGELAKKLKTAPRAIGQACRTNPIAIIVPCHRIVAANDLGGYAGAKKGPFFAAKKWLLHHEGLAI